MLRILRPGLATTVQDLGRWGFQASGLPVAGAMDWYSHALANLLVNNSRHAATLEATLLGPEVEFTTPALAAVAGAEFELFLDAARVPAERALAVPAGSRLRFGRRVRGARAYLAVAGGVGVPSVLSSRSTHVPTGTGGHEGRMLRAGDRLPLDAAPAGPPAAAMMARGDAGERRPLAVPDGGARVRMIASDAAPLVVERRYRLGVASNRIGYRLEGPEAAAGAAAGELISKPVPAGALQVPPDGRPILLMADHATAGGYALAGVVITADLPVAGQLAPGDWIEFECCSLAEADQALGEREAWLSGLPR